MKKLAVSLAVIIVLMVLGCAAYAAEVYIPDLTVSDPDNIRLVDVDAETGLRLYSCDDAELMLKDIMLYADMLFSEYEFDSLGMDTESSDTFVYMYIADYNGDARISPEFMEDCAERCYVLFALTSMDDEALCVVKTARGIEIDGGAEVQPRLVLHDFAEYSVKESGYPIDLLMVDEETDVRAYYTDKQGDAVGAILAYMDMLCEEYGFDGQMRNNKASDTFGYYFLTEYNGEMDLVPELMDENPREAYVLFAQTEYDEGYLILLQAVEGIVFEEYEALFDGDTGTQEEAYAPPIAGNNGLLVMPMEECFEDIQRSTMFVEDDCYGYRYTNQGRYYDGEGSDEFREMYVRYVEALVASGYYTLLEHTEDSTCETWRLGYTGDTQVGTFKVWKSHNPDAAIIVDLLFEDGRVYYSPDIATTNLEEAAREAGLLDEDTDDDSDDDWNDDDDYEMSCPRCHGTGESQCTTCWGRGQVSSPSTSSGRETCDDCRGRGRDTCGYCNGRGTIN